MDAADQFMGGITDDVVEAYAAAKLAKQTLYKVSVLLDGDQDLIVPIAYALSSGGKLRLIKGAGHFDRIHTATQSFRTLLQELARVFATQGL